ncbi:hypothetical protein VWY34_15515 [Phaeobacter sp. JH20_02]|uniref:hypothetical protein n=1 Tax=unclassified Phaeobacter TaxID=2621772 RepID=UPI003A8485CD
MTDTSKEAVLALSIRFHDQVSNIVDALEDEGDRVYLGSTNDADTLRDIAQTVQAIQWEKDEPPVDWHKRVQELLSERDALRSQLQAAQEVIERAGRHADAIRGAVESNQVVDKDVRGVAKMIRDYCRAALKSTSTEGEG